jgi:hypothetical protein
MKLSDFKVGDNVFSAQYNYAPFKICYITKDQSCLEYCTDGTLRIFEDDLCDSWKLYTEPKPEQKFKEVVMYKHARLSVDSLNGVYYENPYLYNSLDEILYNSLDEMIKNEGEITAYVEQKVFLRDE